MPSIYDWSTIAANNGNSDSAINWSEGQAPGSVNGSARAMMQRIKELLNDLGGVAVSGGSANALTLTASSPFTSYDDGLRVSFRAAASNTTAATLNVNGVGAKPIVTMKPSGETALSNNEIRANGIYEAIYCSILNGGAGAWLLLNPTAAIIAPGIGAPFFGTSAPSGWLICNGSAVSRTTYASLFAVVGTTWGAGNGSTTFNLPDGRDEFLRGASSTRDVGTSQTDSFKSHTHSGTTSNNSSAMTVTGTRASSTQDQVSVGNDIALWSDGGTNVSKDINNDPHNHSFTTNATGDTETRPQNIAVHWIIKT